MLYSEYILTYVLCVMGSSTLNLWHTVVFTLCYSSVCLCVCVCVCVLLSLCAGGEEDDSRLTSMSRH